MATEEGATIKFKTSKKRQIRRKQSSEDENEEEDVDFNKEDYQRTIELQKLRFVGKY